MSNTNQLNDTGLTKKILKLVNKITKNNLRECTEYFLHTQHNAITADPIMKQLALNTRASQKSTEQHTIHTKRADTLIVLAQTAAQQMLTLADDVAEQKRAKESQDKQLETIKEVLSTIQGHSQTCQEATIVSLDQSGKILNGVRAVHKQGEESSTRDEILQKNQTDQLHKQREEAANNQKRFSLLASETSQANKKMDHVGDQLKDVLAHLRRDALKPEAWDAKPSTAQDKHADSVSSATNQPRIQPSIHNSWINNQQPNFSQYHQQQQQQQHGQDWYQQEQVGKSQQHQPPLQAQQPPQHQFQPLKKQHHSQTPMLAQKTTEQPASVSSMATARTESTGCTTSAIEPTATPTTQ
jgi:hypothetical protein